jgi:hypothetical protein
LTGKPAWPWFPIQIPREDRAETQKSNQKDDFEYNPRSVTGKIESVYRCIGLVGLDFLPKCSSKASGFRLLEKASNYAT